MLNKWQDAIPKLRNSIKNNKNISKKLIPLYFKQNIRLANSPLQNTDFSYTTYYPPHKQYTKMVKRERRSSNLNLDAKP